MNYRETYDYLKKYGQEHILRCYEELNDAEKEALLLQAGSIDLSLLGLLDEYRRGADVMARGTFSPLGAVTVEEIAEKKEAFSEAGLKGRKDRRRTACRRSGNPSWI